VGLKAWAPAGARSTSAAASDAPEDNRLSTAGACQILAGAAPPAANPCGVLLKR
jgi:hypothetical protein